MRHDRQVTAGPQAMLDRAAQSVTDEPIDGAALFYARGEVAKRMIRDASLGSTVFAPAPSGPIAMVVAVTATAVHVLGSYGPDKPLAPLTVLPVGSYRAVTRKRWSVIELTLTGEDGQEIPIETKRWGANRKNPAVVRLILDRAQRVRPSHH